MKFPARFSETLDTDGDGIGNNADTDDDGDSIPDDVETSNGTNPLLIDTDTMVFPTIWIGASRMMQRNGLILTATVMATTQI